MVTIFPQPQNNEQGVIRVDQNASRHTLDGRYDYNLATQISKHIASFSWVWELPAMQRSNAALRAVAGGWQLNGLVSLRSGTPINVVTGADNALNGSPNQRPNVTGNPILPADRPRGAQILAWFDRTMFAAPAAGTYLWQRG